MTPHPPLPPPVAPGLGASTAKCEKRGIPNEGKNIIDFSSLPSKLRALLPSIQHDSSKSTRVVFDGAVFKPVPLKKIAARGALKEPSAPLILLAPNAEGNGVRIHAKTNKHSVNTSHRSYEKLSSPVCSFVTTVTNGESFDSLPGPPQARSRNAGGFARDVESTGEDDTYEDDFDSGNDHLPAEAGSGAAVDWNSGQPHVPT